MRVQEVPKTIASKDTGLFTVSLYYSSHATMIARYFTSWRLDLGLFM